MQIMITWRCWLQLKLGTSGRPRQWGRRDSECLIQLQVNTHRAVKAYGIIQHGVHAHYTANAYADARAKSRVEVLKQVDIVFLALRCGCIGKYNHAQQIGAARNAE